MPGQCTSLLLKHISTQPLGPLVLEFHLHILTLHWGSKQASTWLAFDVRRRVSIVVRAAAEPAQPLTAPPAAVPRPVSEFAADNEFSISKVSFGSILTSVGVGLLTYGFGAFFQLLPGADLSSVMLIYGFPIAVLGFALAYAQVGGLTACTEPWTRWPMGPLRRPGCS